MGNEELLHSCPPNKGVMTPLLALGMTLGSLLTALSGLSFRDIKEVDPLNADLVSLLALSALQEC